MRQGPGHLWQAVSETAADLFAVPSGQPVTLQDIFWEEGDTLILRVRFLAQQIAREGGSVDYDTAAKDMLYLCQTYILPQLAESSDVPDQVILSLSDKEVPFGESDPEATQFFEAYHVQDGACIWEIF